MPEVAVPSLVELSCRVTGHYAYDGVDIKISADRGLSEQGVMWNVRINAPLTWLECCFQELEDGGLQRISINRPVLNNTNNQGIVYAGLGTPEEQWQDANHQSHLLESLTQDAVFLNTFF